MKFDAIFKTKAGPGNLELRKIEIPQIGDDDLLIEVKAAGICGSDIRLKKLGNSQSLRPPVVIGHEFAGDVVKIGKNVKNFKVGDRVVSDNSGYLCGICDNCAVGNYMMCDNRLGLGFGMNGGFTKYVKIEGRLLSVNPNTLFKIPDSISYEEASLMDPLANAYKAIVQESSIIPGDDVVIFGLGTIGLLAVQVAKVMGAARIIAVNRSYNERKFEIAKQFGATNIICEKDGNIADSIKTITKGELIPLVVDCAGKNSILEESLQFLKKGGEFIKIGYDAEAMNISFDGYVGKGIKVIGHFAYDYVSWRNCLKLLDAGKLDVKPVITGELPLSEWEKAFEMAERSNEVKVLMIP